MNIPKIPAKKTVVATTEGAKPTAPSNPIVMPKFPEIDWTGQRGESIIPPEFQHLVFITGFRGMGKTTLSLQFDRPENILFFDMESKGEGLAKPHGVGKYFSIKDEITSVVGPGYDIELVYLRCLEILKAVPQDRFTTLVIDNASYLQASCGQYIRNHPSVLSGLGMDPMNAVTGAYGGGWSGVKYLVDDILHLARSKGIQLVVVTFQLSGAWKDHKPLIGKFKTTEVTTWHEKSILTLVLVEPMPQYMPIPRALVMKTQIGKTLWDEDRQRAITQRVIPFAIPKCEVWDIYNYLKEPADFKRPKEGETVDALEISPYTPTFSKEQLSMLERLARAAKQLETTDDEQPSE